MPRQSKQQETLANVDAILLDELGRRLVATRAVHTSEQLNHLVALHTALASKRYIARRESVHRPLQSLLLKSKGWRRTCFV